MSSNGWSSAPRQFPVIGKYRTVAAVRRLTRSFTWLALPVAAVWIAVWILQPPHGKAPDARAVSAGSSLDAEAARDARALREAGAARRVGPTETRTAPPPRSHHPANAADESNDGAERLREAEALAYETARTAPLEAMHIAAALPDSGVRSQLVVHVTAQWAAQDPTQAVTWAMQIADDPLRGLTISSALVAWAEHDPLSAMAMALGGLAEGAVRDRAVAAVFQRWHQHSPDEAAAWVRALDPGVHKTQLLRVIDELPSGGGG